MTRLMSAADDLSRLQWAMACGGGHGVPDVLSQLQG